MHKAEGNESLVTQTWIHKRQVHQLLFNEMVFLALGPILFLFSHIELWIKSPFRQARLLGTNRDISFLLLSPLVMVRLWSTGKPSKTTGKLGGIPGCYLVHLVPENGKTTHQVEYL